MGFGARAVLAGTVATGALAGAPRGVGAGRDADGTALRRYCWLGDLEFECLHPSRPRIDA